MAIKKTSRIQYSVNTTLPYILPTLNYIEQNRNKKLTKSEIRGYVVRNHSKGKSPNSEMDIISKIIDRYCSENPKRIINLGVFGIALLKNWDKYPQTRNEILLLGFCKHYIVEYTLNVISNHLKDGIRELSADDIKRKVRSLDIYPELAKNIEKNVTEVLKDLIKLNFLPEKKNNFIYNIDYYKPSKYGLLYYILNYFPNLKSISLKDLSQSKLLDMLLTNITNINLALNEIKNQKLLKYESFADIQKYLIQISSISELNDII